MLIVKGVPVHTDKDGLKIQVGSVVAAQKPGKTRYTLKGDVVELHDKHLVVKEYKRGHCRVFKYDQIKRVAYRPKKDEGKWWLD